MSASGVLWGGGGGGKRKLAFLWITATALEALPFGVLQGLVGSSVSRCGGVRQCWEERVILYLQRAA